MAKAKKQTVPVSMRALVQRINRALAKQNEVLKITRGDRAYQELGQCYVLDARRHTVTGKNVDPEKLGRELGVLAPYEHIED